ncbi:MAG: electron transfer flavoprotein subunit beta/FixA family protein [Deltaproteobacteria bacterium]|nr:electron transfer flavoprotein subunit beta/FixA family protein [Deltaproteobacteria bacterium]
MKILVPLKRVCDPDNANKVKVSGDGKAVTSEGLEWKPNPFDEYAVEAALRLNENAAKNEKLGEIVVCSIGVADVAQTIRQALAMGADRGILVTADDGALESTVVARALKALVEKEKPDLVLMGKQTVDGDSNAVGQMLAEMLGWPMATFVASISTSDGGKSLNVKREVDMGVVTLKVTTPAVVTVDLRIVSPEAVKNGATPDSHKYNEGPRYASLKGIMQAKKKKIDQLELPALGSDATPATTYPRFELPPARSGSCTFVESVDALVDKLKNQAKAF